jgi:hypothetical protein
MMSYAWQNLRLNWHPPGFRQWLAGVATGLPGAGCFVAGLRQTVLPWLIFGLGFMVAAGFFLVWKETIIDIQSR